MNVVSMNPNNVNTNTSNLNELLPILQQKMDGDIIQTVNARNLHTELGIKKDFTDWIKAQISRGQLVENTDYLIVLPQKGKNLNGGRPTTEYHITIDAGKSIAMMSGGKKGNSVRRYFIDCEKQLHTQSSTVQDPTLAAIIKTVQELDTVRQEQKALKQKSKVLESRLGRVEMQTRNGVPEGYLSKKQAHYLYGQGLSEAIFHLALKRLSITTQRYVHRGEDGYQVNTISYLATEIEWAVSRFIDDAIQATPAMCESPMLNYKRFRFVKNKEAA